MTKTSSIVSALLLAAILVFPSQASALERICDVAHENCRNPLISLIRAETAGIDVAFWFMEDQGLAQEIINRWKAGVPVRVLFDPRAFEPYPDSVVPVQMMRAAGVPMRKKVSTFYLHWKVMIFAGQNTVQFSGANYSREAFMYGTRYADYVDEVIYFTHRASYVRSFMTMFDNAWMNTGGFSNYANVPATRTRNYPTYDIDPALNFVPTENFRTRSVPLYRTETTRIDAHMYRITDRVHADEMIAAVRRGVPVRLLTEQKQYRDPNRLWHSYNVDRMYMGGVQVRLRGHRGLSHEKLTLLVGQRMTIFGSSNWTTEAASRQYEHNLFTTDATWFSWSQAHFNRKWNNTGPSAESKPFTPLAGDKAALRAPANGATGQPTTVTFTWWGGPFNHKYDLYLGTSPTAMTKVLSNRELGPSESSTDVQKYTRSGLAPGTTYYWRVVSRTMANMETTSATRSFTTSGSSPAPPLPSGWSSRDIGSVAAAGSASVSGSTYTVRGSGADIWGRADEFRYVYRPMSGNGTITARVGSVSTQHAWVKGGVMIRETLTGRSKHATMFVSNTKGLAFQRRATTGGESAHTAGAAVKAPYWIRLTRNGNTFSAYSSPNGSSWTLVGTANITMASSVYVGLAVTSHKDGSVATVTFSNVTTP